MMVGLPGLTSHRMTEPAPEDSAMKAEEAIDISLSASKKRKEESVPHMQRHHSYRDPTAGFRVLAFDRPSALLASAITRANARYEALGPQPADGTDHRPNETVRRPASTR